MEGGSDPAARTLWLRRKKKKQKKNNPLRLSNLSSTKKLTPRYNCSVNSARNILFAKGMQWRTVGSTLIIYVVLIVIARFVSRDPTLMIYLSVAMILSAIGSIHTLLIYQF